MTDTAEVDIAEALAAGLVGVEASRKVGWAKAFAALAQVDSLSEDLRQTRDELKHLRRAYSRLLGVVDGLPFKKTDLLRVELSTHFAAESSFRHEDAWDAGVALAWAHKALIFGWTADELDARKHGARIRENERRARRSAHGAKVRELYDVGRLHGHEVDTALIYSWASTVGLCSCGAQSEVLTEEETAAWKRDHVAFAIFGTSYREWSGLYGNNGRTDEEEDSN